MREKTLQRKVDNVNEIKDKIERAEAMILVDYRGLNVEELTALRKEYREAGVEYKVYKNTMMRFAFKEADLEDFTEHLTGPNAIAFGYDDPVQAAKITSKFAKEHDKLEIKAGIVDGKIIGIEDIKALGDLPSREVLLAQALGGLNSPIQGFANVLHGTMQGLANVLNAIAEQKEE